MLRRGQRRHGAPWRGVIGYGRVSLGRPRQGPAGYGEESRAARRLVAAVGRAGDAGARRTGPGV